MCIAALGWDEEGVVQVFPVNCSSYVEYEFDSKEEAAKAYQDALTQWKREIQSSP